MTVVSLEIRVATGTGSTTGAGSLEIKQGQIFRISLFGGLSQFLGKPVDLPFDADLYEAKLLELIRDSQFRKETHEGQVDDFDKSFEPYH